MGTIESLEPLDNVTQVIFHSLRRFVLISSATDACWKLSLALKSNSSSDLQGSYWWYSSLSEKDVVQLDVTASHFRSFIHPVNIVLTREAG